MSNPPGSGLRERVGVVFMRAAAVLVAWACLLGLEGLAVAVMHGPYLSGPWDVARMRRFVMPIGIATLAPVALVAVAVGDVAWRRRASRRARAFVAGVLGLAAGALGYGVTFGRHFAHLGVRVPFIVGLAGLGAAVGYWVVPALARMAVKAPARFALLAGVATVLAWCGDAFLLPRLYPAMHTAWLVLTLSAAAVVPFGVRRPSDGAPSPSRRARNATITVWCVALFATAWSPFAARRLATSDNLRLVLLEHAPLLGRCVRIGALLVPPASDDETLGDVPASGGVNPSASAAPRSLDWTNTDIVLLSIDALRADHVSAYGYARPTTPNIDALAREGALFTHAYCPTPHTSYSVTSLLTGKYMRPILALGFDEPPETWALSLRRYDYRTAAFYPPAVFFIDEQRFTGLRDRQLDFEYAKVEFADPSLRVAQIEEYLAQAPPGRPLFLWVHLFEPHEPYVVHPEHRFGGEGEASAIDAYDSEIAAADEGVGRIVQLVRSKRPRAVFIVTADHGEEFGEHGGRYHGTTVYEEQVRVPLVVVGPGVRPARIDTVVQTIDLFPTTLSAMGIPRPARARGRDLGPLLAGKETGTPGFAFAETDEQTLLASGAERLVCARKIGACALYRPADDPLERRDVSDVLPERKEELRRWLRKTEHDHGRFEKAEGPTLPEALRRGLQGEADAAEEVASLLDDANVIIRRKAAEVTFALHAPSALPQVRRALSRDEDDEVRRWCALALVRMGDPPSPAVDALLRDPNRDWRRRAALALAERGDASGAEELVAWWAEDGAADPVTGKVSLEFEQAKELIAALAHTKVHEAVPGLVRALDDVRLRPFVADALGAIGDKSARAPLLEALKQERYVTARPAEVRALLALGARGELREPLERFAGVPEPMLDVVSFAERAGLLEPATGGWSQEQAAAEVKTEVVLPRTSGPLRLLVVTTTEDPLEILLARRPLPPAAQRDRTLHVYELPDPSVFGRPGTRVSLRARADSGGIRALWLVPRADEIPPPPPRPWAAAP